MGHDLQEAPRAIHRVTLSPTTPNDILVVAAGMRPSDAEEIRESLGEDPVTGLSLSVQYTPEPWTINVDGEPSAICGCPGGVIWLLGTEKLTEEPRLFLEESREIWNFLCQDYETVGNLIYEDNLVHRKWLEWIGCTFHGRPDPSRPFVSFTGPAYV